MATAKVPRALSSAICHTCRQRLLPSSQQRTFASTPVIHADDDGALQSLGALGSEMSRKATFSPRPSRLGGRSTSDLDRGSFASILDADQSLLTSQFEHNLNISSQMHQRHRLHVYATKHNTHITFVQPSRPASQTASSGISRTSASAADQKKTVDVLMSLSTGNIGFRKAGRGSYDAAYQLAAFVLKQMQEKGITRDVRELEVVLRGFGAGREAVSKVLLGSEGRMIRGRIVSVIDATRLKQGGPRSKKPRRLG